MTRRICVVMPAWNESEGIEGFLRELDESLTEWDATFIVIDDASTDDTATRVRSLSGLRSEVIIFTNEENSGHGVSTLRALRAGLDLGPELIVALDGDGQFIGPEVAEVVRISFDSGADVVEGVRNDRGDPLYRRATSFTTRALVWTRVREWPKDANTPLRAYRPDVLANLLKVVPDRSMTPNLIISALSRRWKLNVVEFDIRSIPRRGETEVGTTWGTKKKSVPSRRFIKFCRNAAFEWITTPMSSPLSE